MKTFLLNKRILNSNIGHITLSNKINSRFVSENAFEQDPFEEEGIPVAEILLDEDSFESEIDDPFKHDVYSLLEVPFREELEVVKDVSIEPLLSNYENYNGKYTSKFMEQLLDQLYIRTPDDKADYYKIQESIEKIIIDEYDLFFSSNQKKYKEGGPDIGILVPYLIRYILDKQTSLVENINRLKNMYKNKKNYKKRLTIY